MRQAPPFRPAGPRTPEGRPAMLPAAKGETARGRSPARSARISPCERSPASPQPRPGRVWRGRSRRPCRGPASAGGCRSANVRARSRPPVKVARRRWGPAPPPAPGSASVSSGPAAPTAPGRCAGPWRRSRPGPTRRRDRKMCVNQLRILHTPSLRHHPLGRHGAGAGRRQTVARLSAPPMLPPAALDSVITYWNS